MKRFTQIHMLVSYPPSNLNRDDLGRPKTARMGGKERLRISSQSLKRAWRTSDIFYESLAGNIGIRTKEMGEFAMKSFTTGIPFSALIDEKETAPKFTPVGEKKAQEWSENIAKVFGKPQSGDKSLKIEQLAHISPEEIRAIDELIQSCAANGTGPTDADLELLRSENSAVDIAMFGRMLASKPKFNCEAAVQVAHAITVHDCVVEDDYFTAVDDLNRGDESSGAGHVGQAEFGAGVFYQYICINNELLKENLGGDAELTSRAIKALVEAAAKVPPSGKQNSYASRAYASYILAETGDQQPRSLSAAFLNPVNKGDFLAHSIQGLKDTRNNMDAVYGACCDGFVEMNAFTGEGSLDGVLSFVADHND
ncbi:type I-E CRISPR-associated protein Cas7/Cse4/CasC [Methanogenium marinum]|uniref:Type I-E CRISPR-associated protein Cas7/Cse4/CasC n=1 Tax=Methanogenium marinum TaxID=348610 RepID=A0A9Q4PYD9_9EURY|nr:type I-E CRISPR-associated protein Cas7/Cse4/CasC [Methanogenium marinum]MDE4907737.1 type I-E CRISPR-associated protein Cas7/Cse4/CasC [Methanogenium marinum]